MDAARSRPAPPAPARRHARSDPVDSLDELLRPSSARLILWPPPTRLLVGIAAAIAVGSIAWLTLARAHQPAELTLPRAAVSGGAVSPDAGVASAAATATAPSSTTAAGLVTHVAGAVNQPGVVHLAAGARVTDAVDAAGGLRSDADTERINLAAPVTDGQRIYVVAVGQTVAPSAAGSAAPSADPSSGGGATTPTVIDLNSATADQLDSLPGVGPATAAAIVDYRTKSGPFHRVEDLLDVRGIGDAKLEALRDSVTVGP